VKAAAAAAVQSIHGAKRQTSRCRCPVGFGVKLALFRIRIMYTRPRSIFVCAFARRCRSLFGSQYVAQASISLRRLSSASLRRYACSALSAERARGNSRPAKTLLLRCMSPVMADFVVIRRRTDGWNFERSKSTTAFWESVIETLALFDDAHATPSPNGVPLWPSPDGRHSD
jgi:hypothetical protein